MFEKITVRDTSILVVGRDDSFNKSVEKSLALSGVTQRRGYYTESASPTDAIDSLKKKHWDLVLYDFAGVDETISASTIALQDLESVIRVSKDSGVPLIAFEPYPNIRERKDELGLLETAVELGIKGHICKPSVSKLLFTNAVINSITAMLDSEKDPLTKLYNRRIFESRVEEEYEKLNRVLKRGEDLKGNNLSLIFVDFNKFHDINTAYGHPGGDVILKYVAEQLDSKIKHPAMAARIGGDEYALLVAGQHTHQGILNRMYSVFEPITSKDIRGLVGADNPVFASLSVGVATTPEINKVSSVQELRDVADEVMYAAKDASRKSDKPLSVYGFNSEGRFCEYLPKQ